MSHPWVTTRPPPVESIGKAYFTPHMTCPVVTRIPQPAPNRSTVSEFLRVQSGGGSQRPDGLLWDVALILHSYAPNDAEVQAEENMALALAWGSNAQGTTITTRSGASYYVTYSTANGLATKQGDPAVDLVRYKGVVTWRVQGVTV